MSNALRIITIILLTGFGIGIGRVPTTADEAQVDVAETDEQVAAGEPAPNVPSLTLVDASPDQQIKADEALGMFEDAGLELPPLVIEFDKTGEACQGNAGMYWAADRFDSIEIDTVSVCHQLFTIMVHELAHAWDHHNLTDTDRQAILDHWGLERWRDHGDAWHERGTEMAAQTIAYSLTLDEPTDNPDILEFVCSYQVVTGDPLPDPDLATCG